MSGPAGLSMNPTGWAASVRHRVPLPSRRKGMLGLIPQAGDSRTSLLRLNHGRRRRMAGEGQLGSLSELVVPVLETVRPMSDTDEIIAACEPDSGPDALSQLSALRIRVRRRNDLHVQRHAGCCGPYELALLWA